MIEVHLFSLFLSPRAFLVFVFFFIMSQTLIPLISNEAQETYLRQPSEACERVYHSRQGATNDSTTPFNNELILNPSHTPFLRGLMVVDQFPLHRSLLTASQRPNRSGSWWVLIRRLQDSSSPWVIKSTLIPTQHERKEEILKVQHCLGRMKRM